MRHRGFVDTFDLDGAPRRTHATLRFLIGFVLAMYSTLQRICSRYSDTPPDEKWALLILSRTRLTAYGGDTIEGARERLRVLKTDIGFQGRSWEGLSGQERFIEVCSTVQAIESYEYASGALPTALCKIIMAQLVPQVFGFVPWEVEGLD